MNRVETHRDEEGRFRVFLMREGYRDHPLHLCETEAEAVCYMTAYRAGYIDAVNNVGAGAPHVEWGVQ
jgi:hypothetical protein